MYTPAEVINEARGVHPAFDERQTPDETARQLVDRYDEILYQKVLRWEPDLLLSTETISFPLSDFDVGYDLPDFQQHRGGDVFFENSEFTDPLHIVPFRARHTPGVPNSAFIAPAGKLRFVGEANDWQPVSKVEFYYIPVRTALGKLDDTSVLPQQVKPAVVERLALFMAARGPEGKGEGEVPIPLTRDDWKATEQDILRGIADRSRADSTYVQERW